MTDTSAEERNNTRSPEAGSLPVEAAQARAIGTLVIGVLGSRVLGFLRDMFLAFLLGAGADAFLVAFRIPNFFRRLLAEGSLGMAYGAAVVRVRARRGTAAAGSFGRAVAIRICIFSLPVTAFAMWASGALAFAVAPGLPDALHAECAVYIRYCLPYVPLCLIGAIAFSHAVSFGEVRPQAWASAILNIAIILFGILGILLLPRGSQWVERILCIGIVSGGFVQAIVARRCFSFGKIKTEDAANPEYGWRSPEVRALARSLPGSALGAAPHQMHVLGGTVLASFFVPGSISAVYFAERLVELALGLAGIAVGIAVVPRLSAYAIAGDLQGFSQTLAESVRLTAFISLPATAGLFVLALPLSGLLFGYGAYDSAAVTATAAALKGYAPALPALCANRPLLAAANALELEKISFRIVWKTLIPLAVTCLCGISVTTFAKETGPASAFWIGLGLSAAAWSNIFLLRKSIIAKGIICPARKERLALVGYSAAAVLMAALLEGFLPLHMGKRQLLSAVVGSAALWFAGFYVMKNKDARALLAIARRK